jgi:hypothetical protein
MRLLLYKTWQVESPLKVNQLLDGMRKRIEPSCPTFIENKFLWGRVDTRGFTVSRIIHNSSFFPHSKFILPVLSGIFIDNGNGTTIKITMTLRRVVWVFLAAVLAMAGPYIIVLALAGILVLAQEGDWFLINISGVIGLVAPSLVIVGYLLEASKSEKLLAEVLVDVHKESMSVEAESEAKSRGQSL